MIELDILGGILEHLSQQEGKFDNFKIMDRSIGDETKDLYLEFTDNTALAKPRYYRVEVDTEPEDGDVSDPKMGMEVFISSCALISGTTRPRGGSWFGASLALGSPTFFEDLIAQTELFRE